MKVCKTTAKLIIKWDYDILYFFIVITGGSVASSFVKCVKLFSLRWREKSFNFILISSAVWYSARSYAQISQLCVQNLKAIPYVRTEENCFAILISLKIVLFAVLIPKRGPKLYLNSTSVQLYDMEYHCGQSRNFRKRFKFPVIKHSCSDEVNYL